MKRQEASKNSKDVGRDESRSVSILGIRVDVVTRSQVMQRIEVVLESDRQRMAIATVNPEFIMAAQRDEHFAAVLGVSDLNLADGVGVLWAANVGEMKVPSMGFVARLVWVGVGGAAELIKVMLGGAARYRVLPEKISGSDLSWELASWLEGGGRLGLLGEREGVAERVRQVLQERYPGLEVPLAYAGDGSEAGDADVLRVVNDNPGEVLLVAYGAPKQEYWIGRNLVKTPYRVAMGVGGTFRFMAGEVRRAPGWMQRLGLEWLFRLLSEPWRWRRQLALPRFVWAVIWHKAGGG